jgi:hypothetical protein
MNLLRLSKAAKVSRATLYRIVDGEAGEIDEETLGKIALALGVPRPRVVRMLYREDTYQIPLPTPSQMLREAQQLLRRAGKMAAPGAISPPAAGASSGMSGDPVPQVLRKVREKKAESAPKRSRRKSGNER